MKITLKPVSVPGKEHSMEHLHKELMHLVKSGDLDHLEITVDGVAHSMVLETMTAPDGHYKADHKDPTKDVHTPIAGGASGHAYEYHLINK